MPKKVTPEAELAKCIDALKTDFDRWYYLYQNGGSDPFYTDGVNLQLVRNHIINDKRKINELCETHGLLVTDDILNKPLPDEVSQDYMARADEIKQNAIDTLARLEHDYTDLPPRVQAALTQLKSEIYSNDLVSLRRKDYDYFVQSINREHERLAREPDKPVQVQFNLPTQAAPTLNRHDEAVTLIKERYENILSRLPNDWRSFLDCAANVYKHSFGNQAMIYAQSPHATAVADEATWRKAGRSVRFDGQAIISIVQKADGLQERRLYDVSQTAGKELELPSFKLAEGEREQLYKMISEEHKLSDGTLTGVLSKLSRAALLSTKSTLLAKHGKLIHSSVMYIIGKQLDIHINPRFDDIAGIDTRTLIKAGELIQQTSRKLLDTLNNQIIQIRNDEYGKHSNDRRNDIHPNRQRTVLEPEEQYRLQAGHGQRYASDVTRLDDSTTARQLSFGQIRTDSQAVYGGTPQHPPMGAYDGRHTDDAPAPAGERVEGYVHGPSRQAVEEAPTPDNTEPQGDRTAYVMDSSDRGGNDAGGRVSSDIGFSPKARYADNVAAIKLLKQLEDDELYPTEAQVATLSRYVGWGGLPQAFDDRNSSWEREYEELQSLLTPEEYTSARESTLTAFYTDPAIISAIYTGVSNALPSVDGMRLLEPACGDGRFFSAIPKRLSGCELHGVELDSLTGRLAQMLHPEADIKISGYQDVRYPDNHFDVIVGNVPFGNYKISDERHSMLIHDFFFARSLDKLKPNGVMSFITSSGTMDKRNPGFRKWLSQRAELVTAVRLPDNAFKANAGTEITTDILILRKLEHEQTTNPDWVNTVTVDGNPVNEYYANNPSHLLGSMTVVSSRFGSSTALKASPGVDVISQLTDIMSNITYGERTVTATIEPPKAEIPADPNVKNFTYAAVGENIYYRKNDSMFLCNDNQSQLQLLVKLRQALHDTIDIQMVTYNDDELSTAQTVLNQCYDDYTREYGNLSTAKTKRVFADDADYPLLLSLEDVSPDGSATKARIFTEATIKPHKVFKPESYEDLITLSMTQLGRIDVDYMAAQYNVTMQDVIDNLDGKAMFFDPEQNRYMPSNIYLSGNVRHKLAIARESEYPQNITALEQVQPKPLSFDEINIKLGSSFIDPKYYRQFMYELAQTPAYMRETDAQSKSRICLTYNVYTSEYTIYNKQAHDNVHTNTTYGTERKNLYDIIEASLNLQDVRVYDHITTPEGKERNVVNGKETALARRKQELVRHAFTDWLVEDADRVNDIVSTYNERFNVYRTVEYDGSNLQFDGMSNAIGLLPHQRNAVARCLYSGKNALLAHEVGAGKTYPMAAAAMELKRLGIANKSLFVVPNHLIEQWGSDFMKLYPGANILVATKKDFEPINRKRFISRIATGEYDAIIIGHSQFGRIPMSDEYVKTQLEEQLNQISVALERIDRRDNTYTVKQFEMQQKRLQEQIKNIKSGVKDDTITFEQTGIDNLFVDEAHGYKNCFVHTKMNNVAGVSTTNAQKSFDMLLKTKYITEKNNGRGVTFATGTPISNSMTEMFVMQRYLQNHALKRASVAYFDEWASVYGETVSALELKPEGSGYRMKTRFAKFHNLPELMGMFSEVADIKVAADLHLPVPRIATGKAIIEVSKSSEYVKAYIKELAARAEDIRNGQVEPWEDNMLKITSEGKAVAIDARLVDPNAPVDPDSKIYRCCNNVYDLYKKHDQSLQLIFLDTGLPLYEVMRNELVEKGIPKEKVVFIHEAKTDEQKARLFTRCRNGEVAVLIGSTQKMGAGTNVQTQLIANHHLDCPWRPADIEQRDGRIIRRGNLNDEVYIYRYITENTFDAYLWSIQENKQKFISQIMTNKSVARSCDDIDDAVLNCAEVKTLATGDPRIKEKMELDNDVYMLQLEKSSYQKSQLHLKNLIDTLPKRIEQSERTIEADKADIAVMDENHNGNFHITLGNFEYNERAEAAQRLAQLLEQPADTVIGSYRGLTLRIERALFWGDINKGIALAGVVPHHIEIGSSALGNITRIENCYDSIVHEVEKKKMEVEQYKADKSDAEAALKKPFDKEHILRNKLIRQAELNTQIELEQSGACDNLAAIENVETKCKSAEKSNDNELEL